MVRFCNTCDGSGRKVIKCEQKCRQCRGTGEIWNLNNRRIICNTCSGSRYVKTKIQITCDSCSGKGYFD